MADDPFDFLEEPAGEAQPAPEAPAEAAPRPDPAPAGEGAPQGQEPAQEQRTIPLATALDWRDGQREEKRRREALEAEVKRLRDAEAAKPSPTVYDDPAQWEAAQQRRMEKFETDTRMGMSGRFAAQQYGQDVVQAAMAWGAEQNTSDPLFGQRFMTQPDPFGWLVDQHRRDQQVSKLGGKTFEEAAKEWAQANGFQPGAEQQPASQEVPSAQPPARTAPPAPVVPPKSLASAPPAAPPSKSTLSEKDMAREALFG